MSKPHRVVIADYLCDDLAPEREVLGDLAEIVALDAFAESDLTGRIENADAVMLYHNLSLTRATIQRLTQCRVIVRCGVGIDNVDRDFARQRGIPVCNVPDYGTEDVADSAIGMALALARGIHYFNSKLRSGSGKWDYSLGAPLARLRQRVFGIVGLGRIGTAAALRAKALGMNVEFFDPYLPDGVDKALGVRRAETLEELLVRSHILSLHCPLTAQTRHMIDGTAIARLPHGAFLVNTARGAVVDTSAVPPAIASGRLAGAAIDVLETEPPAPEDPLVAAWRDPQHAAHHRVILNPHAAFYSEEGLRDMRVKGSQACRRALLGQPLRNVVNA